MTEIYGNIDPRNMPTYGISEAARYLGIPTSTLRSWTVGSRYRTKKDGWTPFEPVIQRPDPESNLLSFTNLVEAHVLSSIRKVHRVSLAKVRAALDYTARHLNLPHPLAHEVFQTDGLDLFVDQYGSLVSASGGGQVAIREVMSLYLDRIGRDDNGLAAKLFPLTRLDDSDQPRTIVVDPRISFGRPVLAGTGVPTSILVDRYRAGESAAHLAEDYRCPVESVEDAIRCELNAA